VKTVILLVVLVAMLLLVGCPPMPTRQQETGGQ